jgi:galactose-1-phosphate uridylyltransferase
MRRHLSKKALAEIQQSADIKTLDIDEIKRFFLEEQGIADFAPDGYYQVDPRNGDRIVYNTARARRPHDNRPEKEDDIQSVSDRNCLICQGKTTHILDAAPLSEGFTFINKNLFPIFYPQHQKAVFFEEHDPALDRIKPIPVEGFHFLQWTSSFHDKDWHNMPHADCVIVMKRLAALEEKMLTFSGAYVSIIKNFGHLVGGSLVHGHQQIAVSNVKPNKFSQDEKFLQHHGESFSSFLLSENPANLVVRDYGPAVLMTPYFMRRPYDMFLMLKDTAKAFLHQMDADEIDAVVDGWQDGIRIMLKVMPRIGKETAYNITTHNSPGGGLYFEFLPYTQEMGGFEHLGLYLCQGNPEESAKTARALLETEG